MKRYLLFTLMALLFAASPALAANTVNTDTYYRVTTISAMDEDWDWQDTFTDTSSTEYIHGPAVLYIIFQPGAASDYLQICEGAANGPEYLPAVATDEGALVVSLEGQRAKLVIDYSDSTLSAGHKITIIYRR
jgi:hypothetical protein